MAISKLALIAVINCALLKNAEHVQYHTNIRGIIDQVTPAALGIANEVYDPYKAAIALEQDIVNAASGSIITAKMNVADEDRNRIYRRVVGKLKLCEIEYTDSAQYKAWPVVEKNLITPYGSAVTELAMQEKTATITGFVQDCRSFLTEEEVEAIGIDADLDDLSSANQRYARFYQERIDERSKLEVGSSSAARAATDAAWKLLYTQLNWLANNTDTAAATKTAKCVEAVAKINVVTEEARQRLTYRLKANKAFVDKVVVNDDPTLSLPLPMEEVGFISVLGNKLSADNVKVTVLEKATAGTSKHKTYTVAEFIDRFDGTFEIVKNESTGVETLTISGFMVPSALDSATIENVGLGGE